MANGFESNTSLAVLIDADNASPAVIEGLLAEIAKIGVASVKRIYGDWTTPNLGTWKSKLLEYSIQPIQQFSYTTGKNSTDNGWAGLGPVGGYMNKTANDFDPRNYGFNKLSELIAAIGLFEIDRREKGVYVKDTRKK